MTSPAERAAIQKLTNLSISGGSLDRAKGDFRQITGEFLHISGDILFQPHVRKALSFTDGTTLGFDDEIPEELLHMKANFNSLTGITGVNVFAKFCVTDYFPNAVSIQARAKFGIRKTDRIFGRDKEIVGSVLYGLRDVLRYTFDSDDKRRIIGADFFTDTPESRDIVAIMQIQTDDFVKYPELFHKFRDGVNKVIAKATSNIEEEKGRYNLNIVNRILQESVSLSIPDVMVSSPTDKPLSVIQIEGIVQQVLAQNPRILRLEEEGATRQDLQVMLTALMETTARDTTRTHDDKALQQAYATLRYFAGGNTQAQQAVEAFITNSVNLKDPNRVFGAVLKIAGGFIPGAQGIVALVEALKEWTRP